MSKRTRSPPNDAKWCLNNIDTLTFPSFATHLKLTDKKYAYRRYLNIISKYIPVHKRDALNEDFKNFKTSRFAIDYWINVNQETTKAETRLAATEYIQTTSRAEARRMNESIANGNEPEIDEEPFFTSTSTDNTFIPGTEDKQIAHDRHIEQQYYLSLFEISSIYQNAKLESMDKNITFEERAGISSVVVNDQIVGIQSTVTFGPHFQSFLNNYRRSISFGSPLILNDIRLMSPSEQNIACSMKLIASGITKDQQLLPISLTKKHVVYLIQCLVLNSSFHINWDVTSNAYLNCNLNIIHCRHDVILITKDGLEIGTGEIKPYNSADDRVEHDKIRILESLKKQLNMRIVTARSPKELQTFDIMINADMIELSRMVLSVDGQYEYSILQNTPLSTTKKDFSMFDLTLETLMSFITLIEESLLLDEELNNALIFNNYSKFIKPTVYMYKDNDDEKDEN